MPDLVFPDDDRYALSRSQFIGRPQEVLPQAIARCKNADDVREALELARHEGWEFAIRGGGHSNACHSSSSGLVLDLSPADEITFDGTRVTVGAGVRVGQVAQHLAPHERLVPSGSCPSVGLVGAALGGGFGSHGRQHGLTCDHLESVEIVLADGRVITADADHEPDLFWALRGAGGGNFGVVTKAVFRTVSSPARTHVRLAWPIAHAPELIRRWQRWPQPDDVSLELILLSPDHPDDPQQVVIIGAVQDDEHTGFLDIPPDLVETARVSRAGAAQLHPTPYSAVSLDPIAIPLTTDRPGMCTSKTEFFDDPLPDDAIDALLAHFTAGRVHGELREVAFTPWGGAYGRVPSGATAFAHRDAAYLVKHTVLVGPVGAARRGHEALDWLARSWQLTHPHGTGRSYANFPDPALDNALTSYYSTNLDRLTAVKAAYDPENFFRFAQSLELG
ncbi:FAD-binding oxidoreductase [Lentzea tibetensis]|uniref:FAD-binding oxidoreductase n=1 Tax=Lentzea tibetensis TaxID=2591470 RepID=A0A563EU48_9PSEU|nr:FAD-binding oxidoreductase [Lentzea tibetensis]TWP50654.1 FAD-binding oxidoreductase [Lentzea tibetensis]